ncbi:C45 family autoproteolytic acyltransferase/hydolase [Aeoliella mucimassa]|uniref:Acyl-coenzyme A:6-aminopenicillanic acid acyl-transferase n=1 Tax=Aeoliella mucimassa TaxID=2527972 RepID=A0A518AKZ9_9BACT|nr:C45 family peptidase [Aeoliella mucimassa]QDU55412.1 Acyl-coenzyme A:6-aminopenicillanic acid acyl-transferase [Aeoliella mucimassa]
MSTWTACGTLDLDLALPVRRRFLVHRETYQQAAEELLVAMKQEMPSWLPRIAHLVDLRTARRFHSLAKAQAEVMGIDWRDLMIAGVAYDLTLAYFGCSTMAHATQEGPVLARNMDWWPERPLARHSYVFRELDGPMARTTVAGWPGAIGLVTGMSQHGFALAMNAVGDGTGLNKTGYPVMLHLRRVIDDCRSFDQAVERVAQQSLAAPCLVTIVGTENHQRVCVERTPTTCCIRRAEGDDPLLTTNHYQADEDDLELDAGSLGSTSCGRLAAMQQLLPTDCRAMPDDELLYVLSDSQVRLGITAQHIVMRPRENRMQLCVPTSLVS